MGNTIKGFRNKVNLVAIVHELPSQATFHKKVQMGIHAGEGE